MDDNSLGRSSRSNNLIPVTKLADYVAYPSVNQARWWIFKNYKDFSTECTLKVGKRILIDLDALLVWLMARGAESKEG